MSKKTLKRKRNVDELGCIFFNLQLLFPAMRLSKRQAQSAEDSQL